MLGTFRFLSGCPLSKDFFFAVASLLFSYSCKEDFEKAFMKIDKLQPAMLTVTSSNIHDTRNLTDQPLILFSQMILVGRIHGADAQEGKTKWQDFELKSG